MRSPIADRYRLDEVIAAGGMGTVWRGHDTRLNRPVAVKLLRDTTAADTEGARRRFEHEAMAAARLQGPGFAAVHDHGETVVDGEKLAYLVMELVEGTSLSTLVGGGEALEPERAMEIVAAVADTLQVVHGAGIIHRDIKPGNVLVTQSGQVKLVDFGIARINDVTSLTSTGVALGTLSYASPEQLNMRELTHATDIYSLGAVAYQCLAGRPPFDSGDQAAVIAAHLTAEPPPLPDRVPDPIGHVVLRALEKDPRDRWASAEEFATACRDAAAGDRTVLRRRAPARRRKGHGMWSWRGGVVAAAVIALLLLTTALAWSPLTGNDDPSSVADGGDTVAAIGTDDTPSDGGPSDSDPSGDARETPDESASPSDGGEASAEGESGGSGDGSDDGSREETGGSGGGGAEEGDTSGSGGGGDTAGSGGGGGGGGGSGSTDGTVPAVVGMSTSEAESALNASGFTNIQGTAGYGPPSGEGRFIPESCEVLRQSPEPGTALDTREPVQLTYYYVGSNCGFPLSYN